MSLTNVDVNLDMLHMSCVYVAKHDWSCFVMCVCIVWSSLFFSGWRGPYYYIEQLELIDGPEIEETSPKKQRDEELRL